MFYPSYFHASGEDPLNPKLISLSTLREISRRMALCRHRDLSELARMGSPTSGIAWKTPTIGGKPYDLSHLHPYLWTITIPPKGETPALQLNINVTFGLHCFARDQLPGEKVDAECWYSDSREKRVFCLLRWELSKQLPEIIATLDRRRCMHTKGEEFVTVEVAREGRILEYAVFFTVTKAKKAEGAQLNLFVNSAHERYDPLTYKKPISFKFIVLNRFQGKKIKKPA